MIRAELAPGTWLVELPNGHRLVGRLMRRDVERARPGLLAVGRAVRLQVIPADMSHGWIKLETQDK